MPRRFMIHPHMSLLPAGLLLPNLQNLGNTRTFSSSTMMLLSSFFRSRPQEQEGRPPLPPRPGSVTSSSADIPFSKPTFLNNESVLEGDIEDGQVSISLVRLTLRQFARQAL